MAPVRDLTPGSDGVDSGAEEIRDRHPADPVWRADALASSRHRRLTEEIPQPKEDFDNARAEALCAEICREVLRDYAPGLALLPPADRRRVQALTAYTRTLFDFARQRGLEGERLAQINRWEFTLESALSGQPVGQPVFVAMARCDRERPWSREALDLLAIAARRSVTQDAEHPWNAEDDRRLARALLAAWRGDAASDAMAEYTVATAIAMRRLSEGGGSKQPPGAELAPRGRADAPPPRKGGRVETSRVGEGARRRPGARTTASYLRFVELTNAALERRGSPLGLATRLSALVRSRFFGRR
jgi:hypothetical protein